MPIKKKRTRKFKYEVQYGQGGVEQCYNLTEVGQFVAAWVWNQTPSKGKASFTVVKL